MMDSGKPRTATAQQLPHPQGRVRLCPRSRWWGAPSSAEQLQRGRLAGIAVPLSKIPRSPPPRIPAWPGGVPARIV